jgi:hypothetical protein
LAELTAHAHNHADNYTGFVVGMCSSHAQARESSTLMVTGIRTARISMDVQAPAGVLGRMVILILILILIIIICTCNTTIALCAPVPAPRTSRPPS